MVSKIEKIELALIPMMGLSAWALASFLPAELGIGRLTLTMSALLLLQSLIRDVAILSTTKAERKAAQSRTMRCMCVESTIGMSGIFVGAGLLGFGFGPEIRMNALAWVAVTVLTLCAGFAIKDFILKSNPWRIVRDKDHLNIVVSWRK